MDSAGSTVVEGTGSTSHTFTTCGVTPSPADKPPPLTVTGFCEDMLIFNGLYQPIAQTFSTRWYYRNEKDRYLYFDPACSGGDGFAYYYNSWIFDSSEPSTTAESDLDGDGTCTFVGVVVDTMELPMGRNTWEVGCNGAFVDTQLSILEKQDKIVTNQQELYDTFDSMEPGNHALVEPNTYQCGGGELSKGTCRTYSRMFQSNGLHGSFTCTGEALSCVIDGEADKGILYVVGTGGSRLAIKGILFLNGAINIPSSGGGIFLTDGGSIKLEFCAFDSCSANYGGAIYVDSASTLTAYGTSFTSNYASLTDGDDIDNTGTVAIFDSCPDGWVGVPEKGSDLLVSGFDVAGIPNSFFIGTCTVCPLGQAGASEWYDPASSSTCQTCGTGEFRSKSESSCTICGAGKYNDNDGSDASDHETCLSCQAGKHLSDDGTEVYLHDSEDDCNTCTSGKYSDVAAQTCINCGPGKFLADNGDNVSVHSAESECQECAEGSYNKYEGSSSCELCGEGKYLDFTGAEAETQCKLCLEGKYSDQFGLTTPCNNCTRGKFAPSTGRESCYNCVTGTYASDEGSSDCDQCDKGKHAEETGAESCDGCQAGSFSDYKGAVVCTLCSGGKFSEEGKEECSNCEQGTHSAPGSTSCETCDHANGFISHGEGNTDCEYCGIGKWADQETHKCEDCVLGKYSVGGVNACPECVSGKYNLQNSASSCQPCEPGSVPNSGTGATDCTPCTAGKFAAFGASDCSDCDGDGKYSDHDGAAACSTAPAGKKPNSARNYIEPCSAGKFSLGGATDCIECRSDETSSGGAAGCSKCTTCDAGKFKISDCTPDTETQCGECLKGTASMGGDTSSCT
ncbi:hypothetical protein TrLO_g13389, partial [Triparma laevis f. longispina]